MNPLAQAFLRWIPAILLSCSLLSVAGHAAPPPGWQEQHDRLVARLRALKGREGDFGPAYQPIYRAALGWYESWGGRNSDPVDDNMVSPEQYATELADALEHGKNYIAENPGALFPLAFEKRLEGGKVVTCNYWLGLPKGFPEAGRVYPLLVGLHGSGWLAHKISFVRGKGPGSEMFGVTPIDQAGPWQIDFLNAYLDELQSILPIDRDRVYLEGHSLGAMATWEWALENPERFAAISPRDGIGEPYRAVRLRNVPAWVIHGGKDDVIFSGAAEQMISALRACGGVAKYSLLPGAPHNVPKDFDQAAVVAWYLRHARSHEPPPADPRESLGLNASGFSRAETIEVAAATYWRSPIIDAPKHRWERSPVEWTLFKKVQDHGLLVDSPTLHRYEESREKVTLWLKVPPALMGQAASDPAAISLGARKVARFYFKGPYRDGLAHAAAVAAELQAGGTAVSGTVWMTPLSLWQNSPGGIAEYWVDLN
jgi:predicted esterase